MENQQQQTAREADAARDLLDSLNTGGGPSHAIAAARSSSKPDNTDTFSAISAAAMRGDAAPALVGSVAGGLMLILTPLSRKGNREELAPLLGQWPDVIQFAAAAKVASGKTGEPGIDLEATAEIMTSFYRNLHQAREAEREEAAVAQGQPFQRGQEPEPVTADDVDDMLAELEQDDGLSAYDAIILQSVWLLAKGTPGLVWPPPAKGETLPDGHRLLSDALESHLTVADYATLLLRLQRPGRKFRGDLADRFTTP